MLETWRTEKSFVLLGMYISATIKKTNMEISQKIENRIAMSFSSPMSWFISEGNKISISNRGLHSHVHYSVVHNS